MSKKYESNPVPTPGVDAAYLLSDENARERADVTLKLHRAGEAVEIQTRRHALLTGAVEMDAVLLADRLDLVERSTPGAATAREVATAVAAGETWSLDRWVDALRDVSDATPSISSTPRKFSASSRTRPPAATTGGDERGRSQTETRNQRRPRVGLPIRGRPPVLDAGRERRRDSRAAAPARRPRGAGARVSGTKKLSKKG